MVKSGTEPLQIAIALDLNVRTVYRLRSEFNKKDEKAFLAMKKRGSHKPKKLTKAQENAIQKAITDKHPEQLKLPFVLWTREAIAALILKRYNKTISLSAISTRTQVRSVA
jgi:transposase